MSLQRNLPANYLGQIYVAVISLVMLPVYVRYLGAEAYGLVGVFSAMQLWFQALDLGLTPTMGRELSRCRAGAVEPAQAAGMVRAVEFLFGGLGIVAGAGLMLAADPIARGWLKPDTLDVGEVTFCVACMGGAVALRGLTALYRAALAGLEQFVALNAATVAIATLRWAGAAVVLIFWTHRPGDFFVYQLGIAVVELIVLGALFYRGFAMGAAGRPRWAMLRSLWAVAGGMAFLTALWMAINHVDKLMLSWTLGLTDFGYFTLAVTLATGIATMTTPMIQVLQPRLTQLAASDDRRGFLEFYRGGTQATTAAAFAVGGVLACFPQQSLWAWTGDETAARAAAPVLALYAPGHAVAAVLMLAFLMQFALGKLRWHVIGSVLFATVWVPAIYGASRQGGAVAVGWVWLGGNLVYLLGWTPLVHQKFLPELAWRWLVEDVLVIVLVQAAVLAVASRIGLDATNRVSAVALLSLWGIAVLSAGVMAGARTRRIVLEGARRFLRPAQA